MTNGYSAGGAVGTFLLKDIPIHLLFIALVIMIIIAYILIKYEKKIKKFLKEK